MTRPHEAEETATVTTFFRAARMWAMILMAMLHIAVLVPASALAAPFAAYVMDARNAKPIYAQNADTKLHPASLTKMMTLYMAFSAIERGAVRLDSKFTISSHAAAEPPSKLGLKAGQQIELRYLIRAAAIKSANDAATAIGEGLSGSEAAFAKQMTTMARALGMRNTNFKNANGLTQSGHYSTAKDMSILGRRLFYDFPQYYSLFSRRSADAGVATVRSTNRAFLSDYKGADGIKTGYTRAAGFNLTASARRGNKRIIATVFGGTSTAQRNEVMAKLLDAGFKRAPRRVREVKPGPAPRLVTKVVRRAKVDPKPVATQPKPQRLVLTTSQPPAKRRASSAASTAAIGQPLQIAAAIAQAKMPTADPASRAVTPRAAVAKGARLSLASSARPPLRPAVHQDALKQALTLAAATPSAGIQGQDVSDGAAGSASLAAARITVSARPIPAPRREARSAGTASLVAEAVARNDTPAAPSSPAETTVATDLTLAVSAPPKPRSKTIILAALGEGDRSEPEATEFVRRPPSGGARRWGISLGLFTTKAKAEKMLVETAIQGGGALDGANRHVSRTKRGWQASFGGLTQSLAQLSCDRLTAQQQDCTVLGR